MDATQHPRRAVAFFVQDDQLVRRVSHPDGRQYDHRCTRATFEAVALAVEETPADGKGTTQQEIAASLDLPHTQVQVALEFLQRSGLAQVRRRRTYPTREHVYLDGMNKLRALVVASATPT